MLSSGKKFRALRDKKKKYSDLSCPKNNSERNKKPYPPPLQVKWSVPYYKTGWEPLSCRRKSHKLTTFYKMHNKLCPQYLCNCLPPTVSSISDHNI